MSYITREIDQRIVDVLREAPRASVVAISEAVFAPRAVVAERLQTMMDSGDLRVVMTMHPGFTGVNVIAHISVSTSGPVQDIAELMASWEESVLVSVVIGPSDLIAEIRVSTHTELQSVLNRLRRHDHVRHLSTLVYSDVVKGYLEHEQYEPITIDEVDRKLLGLLEHDGRASWKYLAEKTGKSPSALRRRVQRIQQSGIARLVVVEGRGRDGRNNSVGVGLTLSDDATVVLEAFKQAPNVEFATATIGKFDAVMTIRGASPRDLEASLERVRAVPGVVGLESWFHVRAVKESYALRSYEI